MFTRIPFALSGIVSFSFTFLWCLWTCQIISGNFLCYCFYTVWSV